MRLSVRRTAGRLPKALRNVENILSQAGEIEQHSEVQKKLKLAGVRPRLGLSAIHIGLFRAIKLT
jgi:hypothetical protein